MLGKRIMMSVLGVAICGFAVGIFKFAALGVDPFQTFMSGLDATVPIRFGTLYIIVSLVLLVFSLIFDRSKIGIATVINLLFFGYIAEFTQNWLLGLFPDATFVFRVGALLIAIVVLCLASSLYFTADLGVSVYDAVSLVASERQSKVPFAMCRVISDFVCVAMGTTMLALSDLGKAGVIANVGVGTIVTAFFMGPLIAYFNVHVAEPMLHGRSKEN